MFCLSNPRKGLVLLQDCGVNSKILLSQDTENLISDFLKVRGGVQLVPLDITGKRKFAPDGEKSI
jgi:hypothetical protein